MSDKTEKFPENAPGRFYVARICIGCTLCTEIAPANFRENTDMELAVGNSYVYRQPETPDEEALCREAMNACPASAVRDDGGADPAIMPETGEMTTSKKEQSCQR